MNMLEMLAERAVLAAQDPHRTVLEVTPAQLHFLATVNEATWDQAVLNACDTLGVSVFRVLGADLRVEVRMIML